MPMAFGPPLGQMLIIACALHLHLMLVDCAGNRLKGISQSDPLCDPE